MTMTMKEKKKKTRRHGIANRKIQDPTKIMRNDSS